MSESFPDEPAFHRRSAIVESRSFAFLARFLRAIELDVNHNERNQARMLAGVATGISVAVVVGPWRTAPRTASSIDRNASDDDGSQGAG